MLFSQQIRNVDTRFTRTRSKIIFGNTERCTQLSGKPDATLWITEFQASLSTVQQQDEQRQHTVARLIEKFESHQHKEQFLKNMSQKQKINRFSEASQKMLQDMDQTEIFELCGNSTKLQCSDCNSFTEIGIIYCSCGRNLKKSRSPTTFQKDNYDFNWLHHWGQSMANLRDELCSSRRKTWHAKKSKE